MVNICPPAPIPIGQRGVPDSTVFVLAIGDLTWETDSTPLPKNNKNNRHNGNGLDSVYHVKMNLTLTLNLIFLTLVRTQIPRSS